MAPSTDQQRLNRGSFQPTNRHHLRETRRAGTSRALTLAGALNYIKHHGSYDWRSDDGRNVLVVGGGKEEKITGFPLLATYLELFRGVCSTPDLRLMVISYSFGDKHINKIIADGARSSGLAVFLIDTRPPQDTEKILRLRGEDGIAIANAIARGGWSVKPLAETFAPPGGAHRTPEYRRILRDFFGWNVPA